MAFNYVERVQKCSIPQAQALRRRLAEPGAINLPGVYDCISAKVCEKIGFDAIYTSGFSISGSVLGMPDVGLLSAAENVQIIGNIANSVSIPVVADCDTGYGGPTNVYRLVQDLVKVNVAAICLEDQEWPKKCGHFEGKKVVPAEEHVAKIKAACLARGDSGMVIIGRTDSRAGLGLEEAIRRAHLYYKAGADVVFVEATHSIEEMKRVSRELAHIPLLSNYIEGGKTPVTDSRHLIAIGSNYKFLMFSVSGLLAATQALTDVYSFIHNFGTTRGYVADGLFPFHRFKDMIGLETATSFSKQMEEESKWLVAAHDAEVEEVKKASTSGSNQLVETTTTTTSTRRTEVSSSMSSSPLFFERSHKSAPVVGHASPKPLKV